ncbi:MAG: redoxin domain-containing protein, partial [Bacteroidaceae bacterium]|nr:redoxin domain-containing protein [Bacteroidaceae bacterium]
DQRNQQRYQLYMDAPVTEIVFDFKNFENPVVKGSKSQDEYTELYALLKEEAGSEEQSVKPVEWLKQHPNSYVGALQMPYLMSRMNYYQIKEIYEAWPQEFKDDKKIGSEVQKEMAAMKAVLPGEPAPLFRAKNPEGKEIGIADLKGKVVLLDFWASWCVPCRKSNPHVKELYAKYHDKGLECFYVSDDDSAEDKWKKAIADDGLENFHHVLRGLKWDRSKGIEGVDHTNDISHKYAVHFLPTKYLIDREGKIIGKFNDKEIDEKLKEIFGDTQAQKTVITGELTGATSDTIMVNLLNAAMNGYDKQDKVVAQNGKFTYTAEISETRVVMISTTHQQDGRLQAYLIPGENLKLTGDFAKGYHMGGSANYDELDRASSLCDAETNEIMAIQEESAKMEKAGKDIEEIRNLLGPKYQDILKRMNAKNIAYIEQNPGTIGSVMLLSDLQGDDFAKCDKIITDNAKKGVLANVYDKAKARFDKEQARLAARAKLEPGTMAPDFKLPTIDGKELALSDLRGKFVIIDFWGSWCVWCIKGMPEMKKYYEKYAGKLEILGVDCRDKEDKWKAAVEKHQLNWKHVRNGEGDKDITTAYAIEGYPTKVIVDPQGKIVKYMVGEDPNFYTVLEEAMK